MASINFVSQSISRAILNRSRLPEKSPRIWHAVNNIANKRDTKLLFLGEGISYALYENDHIREITWIDDYLTRAELDAFTFKPEYNLIVAHQHLFKTGMMKLVHDKLAHKSILVILNTRHYDSQNIISRSISHVDGLRLASKLEIFDKDNREGWQNGMSIFDMTKID